MNQAQLIAIVSEVAEVPQKTATRVLQALRETVLAHIGEEKIPLPGIGAIKTKHRAARTARNPMTGASINIPSKWVVSFSPAKELSDSLNRK